MSKHKRKLLNVERLIKEIYIKKVEPIFYNNIKYLLHKLHFTEHDETDMVANRDDLLDN